MKIKVLILLGCLFFATHVFSQEDNISLNVKNTTLRNVFKTIQTESGYRFFYSDDLVDLNKSISISVENGSIQDVIEELKTQTSFTFRIMEDKLIVVVPANAEQKADVISGRVTSAAEPEGLPGVWCA